MSDSTQVRPNTQPPAAGRKEPTPQVTVRMQPSEMDRLKEYCQTHDLKIQRVIVDSIREFLDRRQAAPWMGS